jgi:hypothetical protein
MDTPRTPDAPQWFYAHDGQRHGPVPADELERLARQGALRPHDLVWRDGMPQWQTAQTATGFFPTAGVAPPPLPQQFPGPYPYPQYAQKPIGDDAGVRMLLPVGRSGWAIAAGYLGLVSILGVFAPFAVIVSIIAIRDIKSHPDRHGMGRAVFGLVMGILGCVILAFAVVGILAGG